MPKLIFVNLPVADVDRATRFYEAIGCVKDDRFSAPGQAAALVWSDTISFMLLSHEFYGGFTSKRIADAHETSEVLLCLSRDSREEVDAIVEAAVAAGGRDVRAPQDHGFMYGRAFEDPDGHVFEPMWMDVDAFMAAQAQQPAAAA